MSDGTPPPPPPGQDPQGPGQNPYGGQGGSTPPPPPPPGGPAGPGGYGSSSPPPPPPPPPGGAAPYSPPDAVGYGWNQFKANPGPLVVGTLLLLVVAGVISGVGNLVLGALFLDDATSSFDPQTGDFAFDTGSSFLSRWLVNGLVTLIAGLVAQIFVAALVRGALDLVDGRPVGLGAMFEGWDKGKVVVAALIVAVATGIGTFLCYLPGLVVGFFTSYTMFFVVDRDLPPWEAVKASVSFVANNLGTTLVYYLLAVLVVIAGAILCGVGLLAAIPIAIIGAAYTYRRLHGQQVAAVPA